MPAKQPNIAELKAECKALGLSIDGLDKKGLQELLRAHKKTMPKVKKVATAELFEQPKTTTIDANTATSERLLQDNEYLFQLDINNLLMYLVSGMLYPLDLELNEVYKTENRRTDAQSHYQSHLLLSKGILGQTDDSLILVCVVLTPAEITTMVKSENFSLLPTPIPVSRITAIYFNSETVFKKYQASLDSFADSSLNPALYHLIPTGLARHPLRFDHMFDVSEPLLKGWKKRLDTYDKLMGMFAFLKNSALFYTNQTGEFLEYPARYFECLGLINEFFKEHAKNTSFFRWIIYPSQMTTDNRSQRFYFFKILEAIYADVIFSSQWARSLLKDESLRELPDVTKAELEELSVQFASYETQRIDYKQLLNHPLIKNNIPLTILVFLIRFSNKNITHSDKQAVRHYFAENSGSLEKTTAEYTLAVLGLYYGYTSLPKSEPFKLTDRFFQSLLDDNNTASIKFKLDSMLDRFVIESIFQFTLNGQRINDAFLYLQNATKQLHPPQDNRPKLPPGYQDRSYVPLDKLVRWYIRPVAPEKKLPDLLSTYGTSVGYNTALFHLIMQLRPDLLQIDTAKINRWLAGLDAQKLDEVADHVELDKKRKKTGK